MPDESIKTLNKIDFRIWATAFVGFLLWTLFCYFSDNEKTGTVGFARIIFRTTVILLPWIFWKWISPDSKQCLRGFYQNWKRGVGVGLGSATLFAILILFSQTTPLTEIRFRKPTLYGVVYISTFAPIAEEITFRLFLTGKIRKDRQVVFTVLFSSFLFSMFHLPQYLFGDLVPAEEIGKRLMTLFVYGIVFSLLYLLTKSIWAAIIPHCLHNLVLQMVQEPAG